VVGFRVPSFGHAPLCGERASSAGADEEAVRRRVLQCTIQDIWAPNADPDPDEIQRIVDETVSEVRAERRANGKANKA
jgi:hypothetical protein